MTVRLIKHEDLDKNKWNSCVHFANRGNAYGYWWYLSNTIKEWDGLVEGEYESVFPLVRSENGLLASSDPLKELGIYSVNIMSAARIKAFLEAIPASYQTFDFSLNEGIKWPTDFAETPLTKYNHQLSLDMDYDTIEAGYSDQIQQQLNASREHKLIVTSNLSPEKIAAFYQQYTLDTTNKATKFHAYQRLMYNALHRGLGFASGVINSNGDLLAAGFFINSHGKILRLLSNCSPSGFQQGANALMFDMIIRTNATRPQLLDFSSYEQDSFALGFGAKPRVQYQLKGKRNLG